MDNAYKISNERMAHMHGVAEYCYRYASDDFYNLDKGRMYILGLLHDCGDYLSLKEIADFFKENGNPYRLITVFINEPQHGKIYQYGNYGDYWYAVGTLKGYC